MTAPGADLLGEADLASLTRISGIALDSCRRAHVPVTGLFGDPEQFEKPGRRVLPGVADLVLMLGQCEQLLRPALLGLAAAGPHMYRKVAA